jgi:hypothetical protein
MESLESRQMLSAAVAATTTTLYPIPPGSTAVFGQSITFTAAVTADTGKSSPTGAVIFEDGNKIIGTASVNASTHHASITTTTLAVGTHTITAEYSGAKKFNSSSSLAVTETVHTTQTTTTVTATSASPTLGANETFTATVTSGATGQPITAGNVVFTLANGTTLATSQVNSSGKATYSEYNWFTGTATVTATYSAFSNYTASQGSMTVNVVAPTYITPPTDKNNDGLLISTVTPGTGSAVATANPAIEVNYTGYLDDGTLFDSSLNPGRTPFIFGISEDSVITGWIEGIPGMKVGETRVLSVPSALGYGTAGSTQGAVAIPPNAHLTFIVQLLAVNVPRVQILGGSSQNVIMNNNQVPEAQLGTDFGPVPLHDSSAASTFDIGDADQSFSLAFTGAEDVELSGLDPADFVLTQPDSNNNEAFTITFEPQKKGTRTATVNILTNDPALPDFTFTVTGVGT